MVKSTTGEQTQNDIQPALRRWPSKLFVETTTRCNLSCRMCVKQASGSNIMEGDMQASTFASLRPAFRHLEALILNGIGEPLAHPRLDEFVREARQHMPPAAWIGFQTNGLLLNYNRACSLLNAGLNKICVSIDTSDPAKLRKIREGAELSAIDKALAALTRAKAATVTTDFRIGIEFVLMRSNMADLPDLLTWAAQRNVAFVIVTHILPYSRDYEQEAVYTTCSDEAIALFRQWRARANAGGVELERYPKIRWNYHKSADDQMIVQFVERMKKEAESRGIFLDLKKLFQLDPVWIDQVSEVYQRAEEIAQQHQLDLKLPAQILKEQRRCEFVEDGSLFVSWVGDVHPCYFLWHTYRCHASGWEQQVHAKSFGSVKDTDILQLWNSSGFADFRRNVISYDYPFCSSCGLAPCDYVQTDQFEQDCHINEEPCGSCLWCMGLFQCLR